MRYLVTYPSPEGDRTAGEFDSLEEARECASTCFGDILDRETGLFDPPDVPASKFIVGPTPEPVSDNPTVKSLREHADALGACSSFLTLYADELASIAEFKYDTVLIGSADKHGDNEAMLTLYIYGMTSQQDYLIQKFVDAFGEFEQKFYAGHDHYERRFDKLRLNDVELDLLVPVTLNLQVVRQDSQFQTKRKDA